MRRNSRDNRVRDYFYGKKSNLYPHVFEVKFSEIKIFKIGGKLIQRIYMYSPPMKKKNGTTILMIHVLQQKSTGSLNLQI